MPNIPITDKFWQFIFGAKPYHWGGVDSCWQILIFGANAIAGGV